MSALSTAAHNKPILVKDLLPTLLPLLYDQTVVKVCFYISGSCSPCSAIFVLQISSVAILQRILVQEDCAFSKPILMGVQKELIRTVDLGPFKHIVDDGLELRKGAFECIDTLLDSCLDQIDPSFFITPFLLSGLSGSFLDSSTSTGHQ